MVRRRDPAGACGDRPGAESTAALLPLQIEGNIVRPGLDFNGLERRPRCRRIDGRKGKWVRVRFDVVTGPDRPIDNHPILADSGPRRPAFERQRVFPVRVGGGTGEGSRGCPSPRPGRT